MKFTVFLFIVLFSSLAYSGEPSGKGKIELLYTTPESNWVRVDFSKDIKNPDECEESGFYIAQLDDSKSSDRFFSALLVAYTEKKNVSFWIEGCSSAKPYGASRPKLHDIYMF